MGPSQFSEVVYKDVTAALFGTWTQDLRAGRSQNESRLWADSLGRLWVPITGQNCESRALPTAGNGPGNSFQPVEVRLVRATASNKVGVGFFPHGMPFCKGNPLFKAPKPIKPSDPV